MSISYEKETWKPTDSFTETTANKWEKGIDDCATSVNALLEDVADLGATIDVTLDKTTYEMEVKLLSEDGTVLSTKTIDFPMETAFVNASYDSSNKKIIFTLESGVTVDVPLGDLVEGLASQDSVDALNQNLTDYGLDNKCGALTKGYWSSSGVLYPNNDWLTQNTKLSCNAGDTVSAVTPITMRFIQFVYFDNSGACIIHKTKENVNEATDVAPENAKTFVVNFNKSSIDANTHIRVYVNNEIEQLKSDLTDIKNDFVWKSFTESEYTTILPKANEIMLVGKGKASTGANIALSIVIPTISISTSGQYWLNADKKANTSAFHLQAFFSKSEVKEIGLYEDLNIITNQTTELYYR